MKNNEYIINLKDIIIDINNHPYWEDNSQDNFISFKKLLYQAEEIIYWTPEFDITKTVKCIFDSEHPSQDIRICETKYGPLFQEYCHDFRRYLSYRKVPDSELERNKMNKYFKSWITLCEQLINNTEPVWNYTKSDGTVFMYRIPKYIELDGYTGYYWVSIYTDEEKYNNVLNHFKQCIENKHWNTDWYIDKLYCIENNIERRIFLKN